MGKASFEQVDADVQETMEILGGASDEIVRDAIKANLERGGWTMEEWEIEKERRFSAYVERLKARDAA